MSFFSMPRDGSENFGIPRGRRRPIAGAGVSIGCRVSGEHASGESQAAVTDPRLPRGGQRTLAEIAEGLGREQLVEVLVAAADRHEDVERSVRLVVARASGDLREIRAQVDRGLRTRRFLGYRESMEWARAARPVVAELEAAARESPSAELVELLQRAIGHVVKTMLRADDSSGMIGDVASDLLDAHAVACDAGVADPVKLARWMVRFRFKEQDFFEPDPVRYRGALGERGVAAYRRAVAEQETGADAFAARYARERLAVLDGKVDRLVELLGGDLTAPYQFRAVAGAMVELGRDDLALVWIARGVAQTSGWQLAHLYELACEIHARRGEPLEVLRNRRAHHQRLPSASTYARVRDAAEEVDAWPVERAAARAVLGERDRRGLVEAVLGDGDDQLAWETAMTMPTDEVGRDLWLRLAEVRAGAHPAEALTVYERLVDETLHTADRRAYAAAVRMLKSARSVAEAAGTSEAFAANVARLREVHPAGRR